MDAKEWQKLLFSNPDDKEIWGLELQRVTDTGATLELLLRDKDTDQTFANLAIAHNHVLKAIAFRHLAEYQLTLQELVDSETITRTLERQGNCASSFNGPGCREIDTILEIVLTQLSLAFEDLNDKVNQEKYLNLALNYVSDSERYRRHLARIGNFYLEDNNFSQLIKTLYRELERALDTDNTDRISICCEAAEGTYMKLFTTISWLPGTNTIKGYDARDFVDMWGIGLGREFKYGMTSPSEDDATFITALFFQDVVNVSSDSDLPGNTDYKTVEELRRNSRLDDHIREQLLEGNFEPAAKYLYCVYVDGGFYRYSGGYLVCPEERSSCVTFDEVKDSIQHAPRSLVDPWTLQVTELLDQAHKFLKQHCRKDAK